MVLKDTLDQKITSMQFSDDTKSFFIGTEEGKVLEYNASNFAKHEKP